MTNYIILDIETTGLSYRKGDAIIEIAALKLENKKIVEEFNYLINPLIPISWGAQMVHGISDAYIARHGHCQKKVYPKLVDFCQQGILVGHNIKKFDLPFINHQLQKLNLPVLENDVIDTLHLSRQKLNLPNYRLGTVAQHFDVPYINSHRAMGDTIVTKEVFLNLL